MTPIYLPSYIKNSDSFHHTLLEQFLFSSLFPIPKSFPSTMQVISLLLFALGATALPTTSNNTLEARVGAHYPWIGSGTDGKCTHVAPGPRPELRSSGGCYEFDLSSSAASLYFGSSILAESVIQIYPNKNCDGNEFITINRGLNGPYTCVPVAEKDKASWVSAMVPFGHM